MGGQLRRILVHGPPDQPDHAALELFAQQRQGKSIPPSCRRDQVFQLLISAHIVSCMKFSPWKINLKPARASSRKLLLQLTKVVAMLEARPYQSVVCAHMVPQK